MLLDKAWSSNGWKKTLDDPQPASEEKVPRDEFLPSAIHTDADSAPRSASDNNHGSLLTMSEPRRNGVGFEGRPVKTEAL